MDVHDPTGPPAPPDVPRAVHLTTLQRIGLPIIFVIPVLALFGVFGEHYVTIAARANGVAVRMSYPDRIHYRQPMPIDIAVWNASAQRADSIVVSLSPAFMRAFSAINITPTSAGNAYRVVLRNVKSGERRVIAGDVAGEDYGRSRGELRVIGPAGQLRRTVATFVFP